MPVPSRFPPMLIKHAMVGGALDRDDDCLLTVPADFVRSALQAAIAQQGLGSCPRRTPATRRW